MSGTMRSGMLGLAVASVAVCSCGDDATTTADDAGDLVFDGGEEIVYTPEGPMAPQLFVCPEGWQLVEDGLTIPFCDPYPDGLDDCARGQAHFPGSPGCAPLGVPCPTTGSFATDLPSDRPLVHVLAGAPDGGDGSLAAPHNSIEVADSVPFAPRDTVLALGAGSYDEPITIGGGKTVWGACTEETQLVNTGPPPPVGASIVLLIGAEVRNVSIGPSTSRGVSTLGGSFPDRLQGVEIAAVNGVGLLFRTDTEFDLRRVSVRSTAPGALGEGVGVALGDGATATWEDVFVDDNHIRGVIVDGAGTTLAASRTAVVGTRQGAGGQHGYGCTAQSDASMDLREVFVANNRDAGVGSATGSTLSAYNLVVADGEPTSTVGIGLYALRAGPTAIRRTRIERNPLLGLIVESGDATIQDSLIRETTTLGGRTPYGAGLALQGSAAADVERVRIETSSTHGVLGVGVSNMSIRDLHVHEVVQGSSDSAGGHGLTLARTTATLTRVVVEDTLGFGLITDVESSVSSSSVLVENVAEQDCIDMSCAPFGVGIAAFESSVDVTSFRVSGAAICGVLVARDGELDLVDGEIRRNEVGACVQVDGYDPTRLSDRVVYVRNGANLSATTLPLPTAATPANPAIEDGPPTT